jgi:hypothetical protein
MAIFSQDMLLLSEEKDRYGGKKRDAQEEEEKYFASEKPTANPTKRLSVLEGI